VASHGWVEVSLSELQLSGGTLVARWRTGLGGAITFFEGHDASPPRVVEVLGGDVHLLEFVSVPSP
jgi:hypothetical protein